MPEPARIRVLPPTVPGNNATVTLFDSTVTFKKMGLATHNVGRVKFSFPGLSQPSAASGLIGYVSGDGGTNWYQSTMSASGSSTSLPATVPADTGTDNAAYDVYVGCYADVKFTFTAAATAPSAATWAMVGIFIEIGNVSSGE